MANQYRAFRQLQRHLGFYADYRDSKQKPLPDSALEKATHIATIIYDLKTGKERIEYHLKDYKKTSEDEMQKDS